MKTFKTINLLILLSSFIFISCEGFMDPGSPATQITTPVPVAPTDKATGIYPAPAFEWNGDADKLQVSSDPNFSILSFSIDVTGKQTYSMDGGILKRGQLYFWRVGKSYTNDISWSNAFSFTIAP
jgi:hypothetical protein